MLCNIACQRGEGAEALEVDHERSGQEESRLEDLQERGQQEHCGNAEEQGGGSCSDGHVHQISAARNLSRHNQMVLKSARVMSVVLFRWVEHVPVVSGHVRDAFELVRVVS